MLRAIFFDLDGTLVDTEPLAVRALEACYRAWQIRISMDALTHVVGRTWESALAEIFKKFPPNLSPIDAAKQVRDQFHHLVEKNLAPLPGVREAVEGLASQYSLHVVSGSSRLEIQRALQTAGLSSAIKTWLGAEDYPLSKPAPDPYLAALKQFSFRPEEAVVFEDSVAGVNSGLAAGLRVIAVEGLNHFGADLSRATTRIESVAQVSPKWLEEWDRSHPSKPT